MFNLLFSLTRFVTTMALCLTPYFLIIISIINLDINWLFWIGVILGIILVLITKPITTIIKSKKEADHHIMW